ncbi:hypothetical protein I5H01_gp008 [Mycobacterium phage MarkPhew]|uniref:Uncharacterized protein n=1 Tax=Mycobacterium phage MarkPhew TaxID=2725625 RepID=A0A6M3SXP2_9CAUD|nr:hypothetical protein I5H01_gp008 [Mycobacterium phage MarkPhew]QJD50399.1 hypothetical protein SEA_MARKPHEW_99 [Mycobacterium phage MarkPhew]
MAAADCYTCGWFASADRHDAAAMAADRHEAKTGHDEIEVR